MSGKKTTIGIWSFSPWGPGGHLRDVAALAGELSHRGNHVIVASDPETYAYRKQFNWGERVSFLMLEGEPQKRTKQMSALSPQLNAFVTESWPTVHYASFANELPVVLKHMQQNGVQTYCMARDFPSMDRPDDHKMVAMLNTLFDRVMWRGDRQLTTPFAMVEGYEKIKNVEATGIWSPQINTHPDVHKNGHVLLSLGGTYKPASKNLLMATLDAWPHTSLNQRELIIIIPTGGNDPSLLQEVQERFGHIIQQHNIRMIESQVPEAVFDGDLLPNTALFIGHAGFGMFKPVSAGIPTVTYPLISRYPSEETSEQFCRANVLSDYVTIIREKDIVSPLGFAQIIEKSLHKALPPVNFHLNGEKHMAAILGHDLALNQTFPQPHAVTDEMTMEGRLMHTKKDKII